MSPALNHNGIGCCVALVYCNTLFNCRWAGSIFAQLRTCIAIAPALGIEKGIKIRVNMPGNKT